VRIHQLLHFCVIGAGGLQVALQLAQLRLQVCMARTKKGRDLGGVSRRPGWVERAG
jgi:hypothetical protein